MIIYNGNVQAKTANESIGILIIVIEFNINGPKSLRLQ